MAHVVAEATSCVARRMDGDDFYGSDNNGFIVLEFSGKPWNSVIESANLRLWEHFYTFIISSCVIPRDYKPPDGAITRDGELRE